MLGGKELPFVRKTPFSVSISRNHISFLSANGIKQHGCFHNCTWHSAYASLIGHSLCSKFLLFTSRESVYFSVGRVRETCVDIQVTKCWPARNKRPRLWPAALVTGTRGAARIFLRGGLKLWKQKLWKGKIACDKNSQESTYIVDKELTVLTTKPGGPSN